MYSAIDLSKYIVSKCIKDDQPISNLQLQKILYYVQKEYLKNGRKAFSDDIEAWQFGPVVPNVYYYFCGYGAMPIFNSHESFSVASADQPVIDRIVEEKRMLDPWTLVSETHKPNGAWARIYKDREGNHPVIPTDLIRTVG